MMKKKFELNYEDACDLAYGDALVSAKTVHHGRWFSTSEYVCKYSESPTSFIMFRLDLPATECQDGMDYSETIVPAVAVHPILKIVTDYVKSVSPEEERKQQTLRATKSVVDGYPS